MDPLAIGARNPRLRRLRKLTGRARNRSQEGAFVVDGPQLVAEVLASPLVVQEVFAAPGLIDELGLGSLIGSDVACYEVDHRVLADVLDPVNPRPLAAVVAVPEHDLDAVLDRAAPILVAVELRDPGNLGTVIRSAEAAGFAGLVVAGDTVDRFGPKAVRASAGSLFRLPVVDRADPIAAIDELSAAGRTVVAAVVDDRAVAYDRADLAQAVILVGNEPHGLAPELVDRADRAITIPMAPGVESMNVGAAAAVLCFEAARQRRRQQGSPTQKSGGEPPIGRSSWPQ